MHWAAPRACLTYLTNIYFQYLRQGTAQASRKFYQNFGLRMRVRYYLPNSTIRRNTNNDYEGCLSMLLKALKIERNPTLAVFVLVQSRPFIICFSLHNCILYPAFLSSRYQPTRTKYAVNEHDPNHGRYEAYGLISAGLFSKHFLAV